MLTYTLSSLDPRPLYEQIADALKKDILSGVVRSGSRLPSKRSLAEHLGVSTITVESAYNLLIDEGYLWSEPKRGYYVTELSLRHIATNPHSAARILSPPERVRAETELSGSHSSGRSFPFSVWVRLLRETIRDQGEKLLTSSPCCGIRPLREAIAAHLASFRGMQVDPDQIIVGAGTEYLYGLLIQLLGKGLIYCLEDPGYPKVGQIYEANGATCRWTQLDESGMTAAGLEACGADVAHISPTHHFPTGITMPVSRRYEMLAWASAGAGRYIIEDDYDSEFRLNGRPVPSLQSIDDNGCVIYMNTFSKTLASTIRISYMVLPPILANRFYEHLSFYSCTVSTFEQYTLARFLTEGYFEKHINRMRLFYSRLRRELLQCIADSPLSASLSVIERDSGLHFLLQLRTDCPDDRLLSALMDRGVHLLPLSVYYRDPASAPAHTFLIHYASLTAEELRKALRILDDFL
ncbi:MAG: PLP-dependent aminotransferase family protein [Oscillospiraceae bacterium]|nr:PLP-dependent aminotransferase family protein [Oscillospiraceae bacterium]